ncbi:MAG TPA: hypothetical protein VIX14_12005 [Terriglobales bacterium]
MNLSWLDPGNRLVYAKAQLHCRDWRRDWRRSRLIGGRGLVCYILLRGGEHRARKYYSGAKAVSIADRERAPR